MSELTRQRIEQLRPSDKGVHPYRASHVSTDEVRALCDIALRALEQNAAPPGGSQPVDREHVMQRISEQGSRDHAARIPAEGESAPINAAGQVAPDQVERRATESGPVPAARSPVEEVQAEKIAAAPQVEAGGCEHEWVNADHPPEVTGVDVCRKCHAMKPRWPANREGE